MSPLDTAVEIWLLDTRRASARALELCRQVASQPEHERAARYRQTRDGRNLYLGHGLARMATARHCHMDPRELQWCCDDRGKPSWGNAPFAFSLSHSGGFVALALAGPGAAIGVDIQEMSPRIDTNRIANYALSPEECTVLDHSEGTARQRRFFQLWVLREAGLKASGEGIFAAPKAASALPLPAPECWIQAAKLGSPMIWTRLLNAPEGYCAALAILAAKPPKLSVIYQTPEAIEALLT